MVALAVCRIARFCTSWLKVYGVNPTQLEWHGIESLRHRMTDYIFLAGLEN